MAYSFKDIILLMGSSAIGFLSKGDKLIMGVKLHVYESDRLAFYFGTCKLK